MKIIALKNFKAIKGVYFEKGKELTPEEVNRVIPILSGLKDERLVFVIEDSPLLPEPSKDETEGNEPARAKTKKKK